MKENVISVKKGQVIDRNDFLRRLVDALYMRNDIELQRGNFRVKGDTVDIAMAYNDNVLRITWWDDEIDSIDGGGCLSTSTALPPSMPTRSTLPISCYI